MTAMETENGETICSFDVSILAYYGSCAGQT